MKNRKSAQHLVQGLALYPLGQYGAVPVYDGEPANRTQRNGVVTSDIELDPNDGSIPVSIEINANITASLISVNLPADGFEFIVNPAQEFDISRPSAQITSPDTTVVNHSVVPVKLEIASVPEVGDTRFPDESSDYVEQSFQLIDRILGVGSPGTAILVLGTQGGQYGSSEDFEHYAICLGRTGIFVAGTPVEQETVIKLYGKVAPDFYGEHEFTVKPTLKTSTAKAD